MDRSAAVLLVVLLAAVAVPAAGAGLAGAPMSVLDGTPRLLPAGESPSSGTGSAGPSVGAAVAADVDALDSRFGALAAAQRLEAADEDERRAVARAELDRVADRLEALRAAQRRAYRGHANGTLTERALLVRLARVHAAAEPLAATLDAVGSTVPTEEGSDLHRRIATLSAERRALLGPVRARTLAAIRGQAPPERTFVQSSEVGVVLATLDGEQYYREAVRDDRRDDDPTSTFDGTLAIISHTLDAYPWVATSNSGIQVPQQFDGGGLRPVVIPHAQGELTVYLDGSTREVFREIHRLEVAEMPTRERVQSTNGSTTVAVDRTYAGGPTLVNVTVDGASAAGVPVLVNGERVGETGPDGQLRTLAPAGAYTVSAAGPANATVRLPEG